MPEKRTSFHINLRQTAASNTPEIGQRQKEETKGVTKTTEYKPAPKGENEDWLRKLTLEFYRLFSYLVSTFVGFCTK